MSIQCCVCGEPIKGERRKFLRAIGVPQESATCIEHASNKRIQGVYSGENGTSDLILVDKLYNDSVRRVFQQAEQED